MNLLINCPSSPLCCVSIAGTQWPPTREDVTVINSGIDQGQFVGQLSLFLHHLGCFFLFFLVWMNRCCFYVYFFNGIVWASSSKSVGPHVAELLCLICLAAHGNAADAQWTVCILIIVSVIGATFKNERRETIQQNKNGFNISQWASEMNCSSLDYKSQSSEQCCTFGGQQHGAWHPGGFCPQISMVHVAVLYILIPSNVLQCAAFQYSLRLLH